MYVYMLYIYIYVFFIYLTHGSPHAFKVRSGNVFSSFGQLLAKLKFTAPDKSVIH